mmetsp:Transcript_944/g.2241  ORF Transcript_944/g.2241 Transcript_944/m.2241 type:complete len:223 (-) Transcript_944:5420-6088(-)
MAKAVTAKPSKSGRLPRNVNEYKHLVHGSMTSEASLEWVLELRSSTAKEDNKFKSPRGPPTFMSRANSNFGRCTGRHSERKEHSTLDVSTLKRNSSEFMHLARHRLGTVGNKSQLTFETGLRRSALNQDRPAWTSLPYKDRVNDIDQGKFFPPMRKVASSKTVLGPLFKGVGIPFESTFEGAHKGMSEHDDNATLKHTHAHRHLFTPGVKLSSLNWEISLRS